MNYTMQQDCSRAAKSLSHLTNEDLDQIMNDDEKIEDILLTMDQSCLKQIQAEKDELLASNNAIAEENLLREPELVEGREKLLALNEELDRLQKAVEARAREVRAKGGDLSVEAGLALLQTAASEIEEESEKIAQRLLASELELDEFLEQFSSRRKLMHLRLVKAEKLAKIVARGGMEVGNYVNAPPVNVNTNYFPGVPNSVPYPTGPIGMPMPGSYFQNHF